MRPSKISIAAAIILSIFMAFSCGERQFSSDTGDAPNPAANPYPADGDTISTSSVNLTWEGSDPDGDQLHYNVYFGESPDPLIATNLNAVNCVISGMANNTVYYWRINSIDPSENVTIGHIWHFTVKNYPPDQFQYLGPDSGAVDVGINFHLTWQTSDPEGGNLRYFVYLGTSPDPGVVSESYNDYYISAWHRQAIGSGLLNEIYAAQESYRQQYSTYCLNGVSASWGSPDAFSILGVTIPDSAFYMYSMTASAGTFSCVATANLDIDPSMDTWLITERGELIENTNDLDVPFQYNTAYYWKVIARDSFSQSTEGPVWSFTTAPQ